MRRRTYQPAEIVLDKAFISQTHGVVPALDGEAIQLCIDSNF